MSDPACYRHGRDVRADILGLVAGTRTPNSSIRLALDGIFLDSPLAVIDRHDASGVDQLTAQRETPFKYG